MSRLVEIRKAKKKDEPKTYAGALGAVGAGYGAADTAARIRRNPTPFVHYANHQLRTMGRKAAARKTVGLMAGAGAINAAVFGAGGAAVGSAFKRPTQPRKKVSKAVERLSFEDVNRAATYGRQAGSRGQRIDVEKALKLKSLRKPKPSRYNDRNTAITQNTSPGGRPLPATVPKYWQK